MKMVLLLAVMPLSLFMYSCQFSKGIKKDLNTGLSSSFNGFSIEEIYLAGENGEKLNDNRIRLGTTVWLIATGVDHYAEKNGRVFPGCHILLTDKSKRELLNLPDAFEDMKEGTPAGKASVLRAQLSTGEPMIVGESYQLHVRFFDKYNQENEIISNVNLVMKE